MIATAASDFRAEVRKLVDNPAYSDAGVRAYLLVIQLRALLQEAP